MTPAFMERVKYGFRQLGVYYWHIGDVILLRILPFLDGSEHFDQGDAIGNSEWGVAMSLIDEFHERIKAGEDANVGPNPIPDQLFRLLDQRSERLRIKDYTCQMVRLVITGQLKDDALK